MNKKLLKIFASFAFATLALTSCGQTPDSSSAEGSSPITPSTQTSESNTSENSNSEVSTPSHEDSSTPSTPAAEEYVILVVASGNATVTPSHSKAAAGEVVTINVTPDSGYLVDRVEINGVALQSNTYSFVMPATSVAVSVYTTLEDKDGYIVNGDISAKLVWDEEEQVYVARNVKVEADSRIWYSTGANSEGLGMVSIDVSKTFANIDLASGKGFMIGGNAIYDFYYDPSNVTTPIYIQRVGVINLPTTEAMIEDLFSGSAKSEATLNQNGVNKVEYYSSIKNEKYEWDLYSDNSSFAKVTHPVTGAEKAVVYKVQNDNVYTVVDNYLEGRVDPNYVTRSDTTAFSGKYDIVSAKNNRAYQYLPEEVAADANSYSHNMESLDFDMYDAYRNGYVGNIFNDVEVFHDSSVVSTRNADGGFTVSLDSWVRWANSQVYSESMGLLNAYITYDVELTFTAAGAIKSGSYVETRHNDTSYDFATNNFKPGYDTVEPYKTLAFSYGYGEANEGQPQVDVSKYFISEISNVSVKGKNQTEEGKISIGDDIVCATVAEANYATNMTYEYAPATALDTWQYGPQSSSNTRVIGPKDTSSPYNFRAFVGGEADIVIGNHTKNANTVTYTKKVTVDNSAYVKGIWMYPLHYLEGADYDDDLFGANQANIDAGRIYKVQVAGSTTSGSSYAMNGLNLTFTYSKEGIVELSYDNTTGILTIDTRNATNTEKVSVSVTLHSPAQIADWPESTLTFTVNPPVDYPDDVTGTYTSTSPSVNAQITFTSNTAGTIYVGAATYSFTCEYNNLDGKFDNCKIVGAPATVEYTFDMYIDPADFALCVLLMEHEYSTTGWETIDTEILGGIIYDSDGYEQGVGYEAFTKN